MARRLLLFLLLLPLALALLIAVETPSSFLHHGALTGLNAPVTKPTFSWADLWSGQFQSSFERWFEQELTFRAELVRTDNTLEVLLLRELSPNIGVVLGRNNTLFGLDQINNYNGVSQLKGDVPARSPESPEQSAHRLGLATRAFQALGVDFVLLFYPIKPTMLPGRLPDRFRLPGGPERAAREYENFLRLLRDNGVPVVDGVEVAREFERSSPEIPTFNRGGHHWTYPLACAALERIILEARRQSARRAGQPAPTSADFSCTLGEGEVAHDVDMDLALLGNVWNTTPYAQRIPRVLPSFTAPFPVRDVLVVGTSFSNHLVDLLRQSRATRSMRTLWYYRNDNRTGLRLPRDLRGRRLLIMEQWQWSYLSINNSEFLDTLVREQPGFAALMSNEPH